MTPPAKRATAGDEPSDVLARNAAQHAKETELRKVLVDLGEDPTDLAELELDVLRPRVAELADAIRSKLEALEAAPVPLVSSIAAAMLEAGEVTKSSTNTDQGYKFASAEAILGAVRRPLFERGVICTPHPGAYTVEEITSRNGSKGKLITLEVSFRFQNGAGEELTIDGWRGIGQDFGDKAIGKAYTNAVKTFIRTAWLLPTEHDDPEASPSGERVAAGATAAAGVELPEWARDSKPDAISRLYERLILIVGHDAATTLMSGVNDYAGNTIPVVALRAMSGMIARLEGAGLIDASAPSPAAAAVKAAQDAAAEAGDPPAGDDLFAPPAGPPPAPVDPKGVDASDLPADYPDPATVPMPELARSSDPAKAHGALRAAGCVCEDPLAQKGERATLDDACCIFGHGIPL